MKPSLPYQGIARRALAIANKVFDDNLVIITSDREIIEWDDPYRFVGFTKGSNLHFIAGSTAVHKYHVVNRAPAKCPACVHGVPFVKRK